MVKDAQEHAEEDEARKAEVEARNNADSMIYATEKTMNDLGDKVPAETKTAVEDAIADLKGVMDNGSTEEIKAKTEALQQASYKLAEIAYSDAQAAQAAQQGGAQQAANGGDDDVVDADYEVVDEDK